MQASSSESQQVVKGRLHKNPDPQSYDPSRNGRNQDSVGCPLEEMIEAKEWFDQAAISEHDHAKIGRTNAQRLFRLGSKRRIYLLKAGVITNRVPSSEKKICRTPCRRQLFVQAFISGSSMIFVACCMLTHTWAH
jgi:hypothetical protein